MRIPSPMSSSARRMVAAPSLFGALLLVVGVSLTAASPADAQRRKIFDPNAAPEPEEKKPAPKPEKKAEPKKEEPKKEEKAEPKSEEPKKEEPKKEEKAEPKNEEPKDAAPDDEADPAAGDEAAPPGEDDAHDDQQDDPGKRRGAVPPPVEKAPAPAPAGDADILTPAPAPEPEVEKPKVGVVKLVPLGKATKPLAAQVSKALLVELEEARFAAQPIALTDASGAGAEVDEQLGQKDLAAAKKELDKGKAMLERLNFTRANEIFGKLDEKLAGAAAAVASTDEVDVFVEAHVGRAEAFARQGMEEETNAALLAAVRLNPAYTLDPAKYPPLFITTHKNARESMLAETKGVIHVDTTGRGAKVFIDGQEMGTAPLKIKDVPVGPHAVRVFGEGIGLFGARVEVTTEGEAKVTPGFFAEGAASPLDKLAQNRFDDDAAKAVAASGKAQGLVGVILGVVGRGRADIPTAIIYVDSETAKVVQAPVMNFDGDLLNTAIEALKARDAIEQAMEAKKFTAVAQKPVLEGEKGADQLDVPTVAMTFEAPEPERKARVASAGTEGGEKGGRRLAETGGSRSTTMKELEGGGDPFEGGRKKAIGDPDESDSLVTSPFLWLGVGGVGLGAVAVVVVAGLIGTGAFFVLGPTVAPSIFFALIPPTHASVAVNLPE